MIVGKYIFVNRPYPTTVGYGRFLLTIFFLLYNQVSHCLPSPRIPWNDSYVSGGKARGRPHNPGFRVVQV